MWDIGWAKIQHKHCFRVEISEKKSSSKVCSNKSPLRRGICSEKALGDLFLLISRFRETLTPQVGLIFRALCASFLTTSRMSSTSKASQHKCFLADFEGTLRYFARHIGLPTQNRCIGMRTTTVVSNQTDSVTRSVDRYHFSSP